MRLTSSLCVPANKIKIEIEACGGISVLTAVRTHLLLPPLFFALALGMLCELEPCIIDML